MSITANMNLDLPTVSVTLGPLYATQNNEAFEDIDAHNHTSGKGIKVPTAGLDINANLNFQEHKSYNLSSVQMVDQPVALTGASNALSISTTSGDLYYTNDSGTSVQITSGGALLAVAGTTIALEIEQANTTITIGAADTYVVVLMDTGAARTVNLPLASSVVEGRIYIVKDKTGQSNTNTLTIARQGADTIDGATSVTITSNYGSRMFVGDGISAWSEI